MCRFYGLSRAGYYAWKARGESARRREDRALLKRITQVHRTSLGTYGSPRVHEALKQEGREVGRRRVARLMRENRLRGRVAEIYKSHAASHAFYASVPNRKLDVIADAGGAQQRGAQSSPAARSPVPHGSRHRICGPGVS